MNIINFAIKEAWELYWLQFLMQEFRNENIFWNIGIIPHNNDLHHLDSEKFLKNFSNKNININPDTKNHTYIGFHSDISDKYPDIIPRINIYELNICRKIIPTYQEKIYDIVVTNVKINDKNPDREYDTKMWEELWNLPYKIAIIPRHVFPKNFLDNISIPNNIDIYNQIGVVTQLCSQTHLTIMWLIFSNCKWETDHNPFEASIQNNAIASKNIEIIPEYREYYEKFWFIHQYNTFQDSINDIEKIMHDPNIHKKIIERNIWIENNRQKMLPKILQNLIS